MITYDETADISMKVTKPKKKYKKSQSKIVKEIRSRSRSKDSNWYKSLQYKKEDKRFIV